MNINAFLPLIISIAYLPLLVTVSSIKPWRRQTTLFLVFMLAATLWSLVDYISLSDFFPPDKARWQPLAYGALALDLILIVSGYFPQGIEIENGLMHPVFGYTTL